MKEQSIQYKCITATTSYAEYKRIELYRNKDGSNTISLVSKVTCGNGTDGSVKTVSISLANVQTTFIPSLSIVTRGEKWQIQRIWVE